MASYKNGIFIKFFVIIASLILTNCQRHEISYGYSGTNYTTRIEAIEAAQRDFDQYLSKVDVKSEKLDGHLKIVTLTKYYVEQNFVTSTGIPQPDQVVYIRDVTYLGLQNTVRGMKKQSGFSKISNVEINSYQIPDMGDADHLLWLKSPSYGTGSWVFRTRFNDDEVAVGYDISLPPSEQFSKFIDDVFQLASKAEMSQ